MVEKIKENQTDTQAIYQQALAQMKDIQNLVSDIEMAVNEQVLRHTKIIASFQSGLGNKPQNQRDPISKAQYESELKVSIHLNVFIYTIFL